MSKSIFSIWEINQSTINSPETYITVIEAETVEEAICTAKLLFGFWRTFKAIRDSKSYAKVFLNGYKSYAFAR